MLNRKQERIMELIMVLGVAILGGFFNSLFLYLDLIEINLDEINKNVQFFLQILQQVMALIILFYVFYKNNRDLKTIGFSFSWKDIYRGIYVLFITLIVSSLFQLAFSGNNVDTTPQNIEHLISGVSLMLILTLIVNSFFEELIVRAYLMTEVKELTGSSTLAVILCVIVQTSYHLYQGIIPIISIALIFMVFSIYYLKTRRIMPLIIAHTLMNFLSVAVNML